MHDGFGCLLADGTMAILRRTMWELLIVSPEGTVGDRLRLERFSKKLPRYVSWTCKGTFLVVFYNRSWDLDIVEIDPHGRLFWFLPAQAAPIGIAGSVQLLPSGTLLLADPFRHVAIEVDRDGQVQWQFGEMDKPSGHARGLSSPSSIKCLADGQRIIADTRNHRILSVDARGCAREIRPRDSSLCDPTYADVLPNGHFLICDTGNARILELDRNGDTVWHFGDAFATRRHLSYPRSVAPSSPGRYVVADTGHDRIVDICDGEVVEKQFRGDDALFWPRCARTLPGGSLLVADARNGRIVEFASDGSVLRQLSGIQGNTPSTLRDPHDVRLLPNDHLLITDSPQNLVLEVDWSGAVHRVIGENGDVVLKDPHSAQEWEDGTWVISDTGHHRILIVGQDGKCRREVYSLHSDAAVFKLHLPRYSEVAPDGTLVIADTGHNRILGATLAGRFLWEFSHVPDSPLPGLNQPRWATLVSPSELLICDHFHHRIVHVTSIVDRDGAS
jgi:hypothetical protein